jgi:hypothetical protein
MFIKGHVMLRPAAIWTALFILVACALAGCSKPPYLVPGLKLPPGATVVMRKERQLSYPAQPPSNQAYTAQCVNVYFDCQEDWAQVSQYFNQCMQRAGIPDTTTTVQSALDNNSDGEKEGLEELDSELQEPPDGGKSSSRDALANMRFYEKPLKYRIILSDLSAALGGSTPGTHSYGLMIMRYHKL